MKRILKKIIPKTLLNYYHFLWAFFSALFFGFPAKKMIMVGITGTKGKSTTAYILAKILNECGIKTALSSSLMFKIGDEERRNKYHMTMVGRHRLQKFLKEAKDKGAKVCVVEVTSEGIMQNRHRFLCFDEVCFTNLSKEHIEAHGGFENYKKTKAKIFKNLMRQPKKGNFKKTIVANLDDPYADYFLSFKAERKIGFAVEKERVEGVEEFFKPSKVEITKDGISFSLFGLDFKSPLRGKFNLYNIIGAIASASAFDINKNKLPKIIGKIKSIEGRMEFVEVGQPFLVIIDLAHTPSSFEAVFSYANSLKKEGSRIISVFGSAGGGRDKWKRPELGKIADKYSDYIVLTSEDSYDEDPKSIISEIEAGIKNVKYDIVIDREDAIFNALSKAKQGDIVLVLGKGTEATIVNYGKEKPWDEKEVVLRSLKKLNY